MEYIKNFDSESRHVPVLCRSVRLRRELGVVRLLTGSRFAESGLVESV